MLESREGRPDRPAPTAAALGEAGRQTGVLAAAVSLDGTAAALVVPAAGGRRTLLLGYTRGLPLTPRLTATTLSGPTFGARDDAALVAVDGTRLMLVPQSGDPVRVDAPGLRSRIAAGERIASVRLAPDGVRLALVLRARTRSALISAVLSEDAAAPTLLNPRVVSGGLGELVDVAWSAEDRLFTVGRTPGGEILPWDVTVDGATQESVPRAGLPPSPPTAVAGFPGQPVLVAANGRLFQRFGASWGPPSGEGEVSGTAPFYPG